MGLILQLSFAVLFVALDCLANFGNLTFLPPYILKPCGLRIGPVAKPYWFTLFAAYYEFANHCLQLFEQRPLQFALPVCLLRRSL